MNTLIDTNQHSKPVPQPPVGGPGSHRDVILDDQEPHLKPIERVVYGEVAGRQVEHALGARVSHHIELDAIMNARVFHDLQNSDTIRSSSKDTLFKMIEESGQDSINILLSLDRDKLLKHKGNPAKRDLDQWDLPPFLGLQYSTYIRDNLNDDFSNSNTLSSVTDWLAEDSPEGRERLTSYLQYNTHSHERMQQHPVHKEAIAKLKTQWRQAVEVGLNEGWLDPAAARVDITAEDLRVVFGDFYDLAAQHRGGYAINGERYIVLEPLLHTIDSVGKHELNHALLGHFKHTWLDEAMTEHLSQVFNGNRSIEDVSSSGVFNKTGGPRSFTSDDVYRSPRDLLYEVIKLTDGQLKVADFSRAYSTNDRSHPNFKSEHALSDILDKAIGVEGVLEYIEKDVQSLKTTFENFGIPAIKALEKACFIVVDTIRNSNRSYFMVKRD